MSRFTGTGLTFFLSHRPGIAFVRLAVVSLTLLHDVADVPAAVNTFKAGSSLGSTDSNWTMIATVGNPSEPTAGTYAIAPNSSTRATSYQDQLFTVASGTLTSSSSSNRARSMNVTNGNSYVIAPNGSSNNPVFWLGAVGTFSGTTPTATVSASTQFVNEVSGGINDAVYLSGNSSLHLSNVNQTAGGTGVATATLRSGSSAVVNFNVGAGSTFRCDLVINSMGDSAGGAGVTVKGGGLVILGAANTFIGTTTIQSGTLRYAVSDALSTGGVTVAGGYYDLGAFSDTVGTVTLTSGTIAGSGGLTIKNDSQFSAGTVSANLTGTSGFTMPQTPSGDAPGLVVFSGVNTYSGTTKISGGTLRVTAPSALSSSSTMNSGGSTNDTSTLDFGIPSLTYQMNALSVGGIMRFTSSTGSASRVTFQAPSGNGFSGAAANKFLDADAKTTVVVSGTFDLASAAISTSNRIGRLQGAGNFVFNGPLIGTGTSGSLTAGLSVTQSATVALNAAGTYTGATDVSGGRLIAGHVAAFGTGVITVSGSGTLDLNSLAVANAITNNGGTILNASNYAGTQTLLASATYASLSSASALSIGANGKAKLTGSIAGTVATLAGGTAEIASGGSLTQASVANAGKVIFNDSADASLSAAFSGAGSFEKQAASILSLTGSSFFGAGTSITAGGLLVTGSVGGGAVTVASNASIGGSGRIGGDLSFASGGKFNFVSGNTLTVGGNTTFGGSFGIASILGLDGSTPDGTYTLISGAVDFTNVTNVGAGNAVSLGGNKSAYLQQGSLQLVVVPEPSTVAIVGVAGLAIAASAVRRRRG
ncbi:MAG: beta strand repeat-containing protein [Planctomycetaceae bacterium]